MGDGWLGTLAGASRRASDHWVERQAMSDQLWQPFQGKPRSTPLAPAETIWTVMHDHVLWSCEFVFRGEDYGWEARLIRAGDFFMSHRFLLRAQAERWATDQRQTIENGWTE